MEMKMETIEVNGVEYVRKDSVASLLASKNTDGLEYCIVRTYSAGVFAGYVKRNGTEATVYNARRLWYWSGAASLSQLAIDGVSNPEKCKFPEEIQRVELTNVIEVIPCTGKAEKSIAEVKIWKA